MCCADKGLTLTFVKGPLQSALGFTVNDRCKAMLREWEGQRDAPPLPSLSGKPRTVILDQAGGEKRAV